MATEPYSHESFCLPNNVHIPNNGIKVSQFGNFVR